MPAYDLILIVSSLIADTIGHSVVRQFDPCYLLIVSLIFRWQQICTQEKGQLLSSQEGSRVYLSQTQAKSATC